jgi:transposase
MRMFTLEEIEEAIAQDSGFCLSCGAEAEDAIEPDARKYKCTACGMMEVFGAEELVIMGRVS